MPRRETAAAETEKGFGTGLRAQLERRRDALHAAAAESESAAAAAQAVVERGEPATADLDAVRSELAAALAREQELRAVLGDELAASERGLALDHELAERQAVLE
ncbi:MAG: hypothetical protein M3304_05990, partial [Actinomycetota bacterium]|nr:hypothetical protein [Actinomycetota bacterium]